jgi:hypothetical protein
VKLLPTEPKKSFHLIFNTNKKLITNKTIARKVHTKIVINFFLEKYICCSIFCSMLLNTTNDNNKLNRYNSFMKIDLVYLWVDINDPIYIERNRDFIQNNLSQSYRYRQVDELKYSLRSIHKHLP